MDYDKSTKDYYSSLIHKLVSKQALVPLDVIHIASSFGLQWNHGMSNLIEQDYSVLESNYEATGLLPFMTFASSSHKEFRDRTDLNTLFEMIKKHPLSVRFYDTHSNQRIVMKKRDK